MSTFLIAKEYLEIRKDFLHNVHTMAGIDIGSTLSKAIYVEKSVPYSVTGDAYRFVLALCPKADLDKILDLLADEALLPSAGGEIHVTGLGIVGLSEKVKHKTGLQMVFIEEFFSHTNGAQFLLSSVKADKILYPIPEVAAEISQIPSTMQKIVSGFDSSTESQSENGQGSSSSVNNSNDFTQALFVTVGSGTGMSKIDVNGEAQMAGALAMGGIVFMGLAQCLLGTNDYATIVNLASSAASGQLDTRVKDVLVEVGKNPYGHWPPDLPLYPFGKLAQSHHRPLNDLDRADVARSLVSLVIGEILTGCMLTCQAHRLNKVYIGGNVLRSEICRSEFEEKLRNFYGRNVMEVNYLRIGHTGAFGAMISKPDSNTISNQFEPQ